MDCGFHKIIRLEGDEYFEKKPPVARFNNRRKSVFAETYDPEEDDSDEGAPVVFPKSDAQRSRLAEAVRGILLFRSLDAQQMQQVLDAMFEKRSEPGEYIIRQGDDGDNFYVIENGVFDVLVAGEDGVEKIGGPSLRAFLRLSSRKAY
ncbi:cAMP-dependent protein kinase type II regulatory subunit-variant 2 [Plutella xylostella]|uniref:cAMP-dependent protein kinase type II regulatory subunit-variant 2 n=1 Tax=Plutella xylostella TaxID=51655 RepID=A0ABQ7Q8M3_PLUXY|nr:cAMP-dependent protein kinase type II regulatory subunit-variant 2 [Plutella xylostella]